MTTTGSGHGDIRFAVSREFLEHFDRWLAPARRAWSPRRPAPGRSDATARFSATIVARLRSAPGVPTSSVGRAFPGPSTETSAGGRILPPSSLVGEGWGGGGAGVILPA